MWVLVVVFSGLNFFAYTQEFDSRATCVAAQEWVTSSTAAKAACFQK